VTRYDISIPMGANTPPWPGDTPFSCGWAWDMSQGASVNVGKVTTSLHVGTHADAPIHVLRDGRSSEALPLDAFAGPARVVDVSDIDASTPITRELLAARLGATGIPARLLLRTLQTVSGGQFPDAWPALTPETAAWLAAGGLKLLAVDAPSVDLRQDTGLEVHKALFGGGAWILENLNLSGVPDGAYRLTAYPMLVEGADAAPVRAVLELMNP
jgi:arylformamidase